MSSPAQFLPALILEKMLMYTIGVDNWDRFCNLSSDKGAYRFMIPLLEVCSAWRGAALDRIYRNVWWCNVKGLELCCESWNDSLHSTRSLSRALDTGNISRVGRVLLHIDVSFMFDSSHLDLFYPASFRKLVLSGVTIIEFDFDNSKEIPGDAECFSNIEVAQAFCDNISCMFPNARKRVVLCSAAFRGYNSSPFVRTLFSKLLSDSITIDTTNIGLGALSYLHSSISNLRHLSVDCTTIESPEIEVIRRNAATLEELYVESAQPAVFSRIVVDDGGIPIVYPRVKVLNFSFQYQDDPVNQPHLDSPAGSPFPALEKLRCHSDYPFGNDILFRGNAHTLECLDIGLHPKTVLTLKSHGAFSAEHLPTLRCANGIIPRDTTFSSYVAFDFFFQLAANVSMVRAYGTHVSFNSLDMAIGDFGPNITVLELQNVKFTLHELLELISHLPHLNKLKTNTIEAHELRSPDRTHDQCYSTCELIREREWRANDGVEESDAEDSYDPYTFYTLSLFDDVRIREFFFSHLDTVYADMGFVDELYHRYYPLSKTLYFLDAREYVHNPMAGCKTIAILYLLCPTIRRVQTYSFSEGLGSDSEYWKTSNIERHEMEQLEQHTALVSRLQLSILSIR